MTYIDNIKFAFALFPFIAFFLTVPYMLFEYRKYGSINKVRTLIVYSFVLYLECIYLLVILPLPERDSIHNSYISKLNLIPFKAVYDFIRKTPLVIGDPSTYLSAIKHNTFYVPALNVLMFIPLGMYLRYYFRSDIKKTVICSLSLSLFFELTQLSGLYFLYDGPYRLCDVDDLIQNTLGGIIGYYLAGPITAWLPKRRKLDEDSFEKGKIVSSSRRGMAAFIDFTIVFLLGFIIGDTNIDIFAVIFILYNSLLPLWRGYTIGSWILKYKIAYDRCKVLKKILHGIFEYIYFFGIPLFILYVMEKLGEFRYSIALDITALAMMLFFVVYLLYVFVRGIRNKHTIYDEILKTDFISTVKIRLQDDDE